MYESSRQLVLECIKNCMNSSDNEIITNAKNLVYDLGFHSIDLVQLVIEIEEVCGIQFELEELTAERLCIIENLVDIVEKKRK